MLPLLALAACGSQEQRTANLLNHRLQDRLATDIAANRVALQPVPAGARVTFLDMSPSPGGPPVSDPTAASARASLVEGLLDPALMRLAIADTSDLPPAQKTERVDNLVHYLRAFEMGDTLQPDPGTTSAPPAGVAVTIQVVCPHRDDGWGYDSGKRKPDCY